MTKHLAVNVDVDSLALYYGIHGLDPEQATEAAWDIGVARFLELFDILKLRATFFVVASDLEREGPRSRAKQLVAAGHELASHTWSHPYDLIRQSRPEIEDEIQRAEEVIGALRGSPVAGFRAPGYNINDTVLDVLVERGYTYDSSLFPCPPYYLARAMIIGSMAIRGRTSQSIVGDWKAALGSRTPRRIQVASGGSIMEYPMCVLPALRFPVIGTSLTMMGTVGARLIKPMVQGLSFINLEFHAIDLLDSSDPVGKELADLQSDLRVSYISKRMLFYDFLEGCAAVATNLTLEELASRSV
jgi:hypothetical protein